MTTKNFTQDQTNTQGRKSELTQQMKTNGRSHRSLNFGPGSLRMLSLGFVPLRLCLNIALASLLVFLSSTTVVSQEVDDTIRIKTRVVFLDALVKDKKTSLPISNLTQENFEVLDNGKPRPISYFTREGQARKPLALILILDLRQDGAGRFMKRPEILKSMEDELSKLPPGDEVAIMAMDIGEDEHRFWLTEFTNERTRLATALARVKAIVEAHDDSTPDEDIERQRKAAEAESAAKTTAENQTRTDVATEKPKSSEVVSTEVIKGKNGAVVTRTTMSDGTINIKRVNKGGNVTMELNDIYDMAAAVKEAAHKAAATRPNSQVSIVWVSDGIAPIFFEDRDATEQVLVRDNIIFNSLTVELRTLFKFLMPIGKPIAGWLGVSLYGSAKHLAQRSGGEAVKVGKPKDYGVGLSRIIGNLTARYSLGFQLAENEVDDGKMHNLEVRVKAKDEKGKSRKLLVSSRQGYYMSSLTPKDAAATSVR